MAEAIAALALCVAAWTLFLQYTSTIERRHAEIANLRSDLLMRLSLAEQRLASCVLCIEAARVAIRTTPDTEDKYRSVEKIPEMIAAARSCAAAVTAAKEKVESMETRKLNSTRVLIGLQEISNNAKQPEIVAIDLERNCFEYLALIQSRQPGTGNSHEGSASLLTK